MAVMVLFTGCGKKKTSKLEKGDISSGTVVMMVGDYQVRYSEVMAYCYFLKCQYEDSFGKELWNYKLSENETIGDQAKQEIVNMITQLKVISGVAQEQEVSLSADEQDEAPGGKPCAECDGSRQEDIFPFRTEDQRDLSGELSCREDVLCGDR